MMVAQSGKMMQLLEGRGREIVQLREEAANRAQSVGVANVQENRHQARVPLTEISAQIPAFCFHEEKSVGLEIWLRRVESVRNVYKLDERTTKMLATNKFGSVVKNWYESQENFWDLQWPELVENLRTMFGEVRDQASLMERMRSRKWKKSERLEDYFIDKQNLARKARLPDEEIIPHIIKGIDNFTIKVQLASGQHQTLGGLFGDMKSISNSIEYDQSFENARRSERITKPVIKAESNSNNSGYNGFRRQQLASVDI